LRVVACDTVAGQKLVDRDPRIGEGIDVNGRA
jgi:hypothetical protein